MSAPRRFVGPGEYGYCADARPDVVVGQPGDINPHELLKMRGIRAWILDLDGTLIPPLHDDHVLDVSDAAFLDAIEAHPELIALIGTNRYRAVQGHRFDTTHPISKLPFFYGDGYQKPHAGFFGPIFEWLDGKYGISPNEVGVMGDGPAHDILGANNAGVFAVQVARLDPHNYFAAFTQQDNDW